MEKIDLDAVSKVHNYHGERLLIDRGPSLVERGGVKMVAKTEEGLVYDYDRTNLSANNILDEPRDGGCEVLGIYHVELPPPAGR